MRQTLAGTVADLARKGTGGPAVDAFVLLGNNLGLLGGVAEAPHFLGTLRAGHPGGRAPGPGMDPYHTTSPEHLAYHERNRARGRLPGQIRMRVRYRGLATPWFDYLFATPDELAPLLAGRPGAWSTWSRRWTSRARGAPATLRSCATPARAGPGSPGPGYRPWRSSPSERAGPDWPLDRGRSLPPCATLSRARGRDGRGRNPERRGSSDDGRREHGARETGAREEAQEQTGWPGRGGAVAERGAQRGAERGGVASHSRREARRTAVVAALGVGIFLAAGHQHRERRPPGRRHRIRVELATIQWVATVYLLVQSVLLLAAGRLGDMWGHKRLYLGGLAVFVLASVGCAMATSTPTLVGARAVQAVGASMLFANLAAIMMAAFPPEQRGRAVGIRPRSSTWGWPPGPPLGGLADRRPGLALGVLGQRPLGIAALALGWRLAPADSPGGARSRSTWPARPSTSWAWACSW